MKVFLVGQNWFNQLVKHENILNIADHHPYILESFFYADENTEKLIPYFGDFLLDSGAFTFMQQNGGTVDWNEYADRYIDFIVRNNVQIFIT